MSIFASLAAPDETEHDETCSTWVEIGPETYSPDGPCDCGQPDAPLIYQGSHVLPSENDKRGGVVDLALIASHITRDGRDDQPEDEVPWPYLRFGVNESTVILTRRNVEQIHEQLTWWLAEVRGAGVA